VTPAGSAGEAPKLLDLRGGDPKFAIDFRRVYATLLARKVYRQGYASPK
jgi:hypothetical protein